MAEQYAFIVPVAGETHSPDNGHPWEFPHGGNWHPLVDGEGRPKPYPIGLAEAAERFFTPYGGAPRVTLERREGEMTFAASEPEPAYRDEDGKEYASISELIAAVKARVGGSESPVPSSNLKRAAGQKGSGT